MAIGDQSDIFGRIKSVLPRWFGPSSPLLDALIQGLANSSAFAYSLYLYAKLQTRILTATDGWLDMICADFFGAALQRSANQSDASFRARIIINLFRERGTRNAITKVLTDLTGRAPIIFEPQRPMDTGAYGAAVAVSRSTTATYIDGSGILRMAAVNEVRYQNNALLIEAAATNLLAYSEQFDNAAWAKTRSSISVDSTSAPNGALTADKLAEDATAANTHYVSVPITLAPSTAYTFSVYAKAAERTIVELIVFNGTTYVARTFNLSTGTSGPNQTPGLTDAGASMSSITPLANGIYRLTVTHSILAITTSGSVQYRLSNGTTTTYTGDGTSGLYLWGAQLETGAAPTSYIQTTSAAATRAADALLSNMTTGSGGFGGYGVAGGYGSMLIPFQAFVQAFRPATTGIPYVAGYGSSPGGYGVASRADYATLSQSTGAVSDADLYAAISSVAPAGTIIWTQINS